MEFWDYIVFIICVHLLQALMVTIILKINVLNMYFVIWLRIWSENRYDHIIVNNLSLQVTFARRHGYGARGNISLSHKFTDHLFTSVDQFYEIMIRLFRKCHFIDIFHPLNELWCRIPSYFCYGWLQCKNTLTLQVA